VLEHLGLEHVDARVDRVREDLAPRGLLQEALDPAVAVRDDDPELERVLDGLEADRDRRAALLVEPAVPAGDSSTEYSMFTPRGSPSPK
jgi:hypothetical protein